MNYGNIECANINDLYQVCYDSGELTATASSVTISGLNGNVDQEYQLICRLRDETTVGNYALTINGDTSTIYGEQIIDGFAATASASRVTSQASWVIGYTSIDERDCLSITDIYAKSGYARTGISKYAYDIASTSVNGITVKGHVWNETSANVTSLTVSPAADKLNIGSRIILMKKITTSGAMNVGDMNVKGTVKYAWQEVYKTTLAASASSVTISGLNGNADQMYRLSYRIINNYNGAVTYIAKLNNDTGTNNGFQNIRGYATTADAIRGTNAGYDLSISTAINQLINGQSVVYVKSGYVRPMIDQNQYTTILTTVGVVRLSGQVWSNTSDNVTSIVLEASQNGGLGTGSYICLERLNL